jgi:hypothetical protein
LQQSYKEVGKIAVLTPPYVMQSNPPRCGRGWRAHLLLAGLFLFSFLIAAHPAAAHKVKVWDPSVAKFIVEDGGQLLADYGSFQFYEVDHLRPEVLQSDKAEVRDDANGILLNAAKIDTSTAVGKALCQPVGVFSGKRLHLVQFVGPVKNAWHEALKKSGAQIISYLPENAYLVYGDTQSLARLQRLAGTMTSVQWDGEYRDDYKIHPKARLVDVNGNPQQLTTDEFSIQLVADPAANKTTLALIDRLKLEPIHRQYSLLQYVNVFARLRAQDLDLIAAQPDVISIQPYFPPRKQDERQDQIVAGNLTGDAPTAPGYLAWLASKGFTQAQFTASGFAVDMSDSGIDNGTTNPNHFALYELGDTSNTSRVIYNRLEGTPNQDSTIQGCDGHGNLNTHIVCAYDDQPASFPHTDSAGYYYDLGVCPFVLVGSSVVFDPVDFTNPDFPTLASHAYQDGARISNNSWGDSLGNNDDNSYNSDSQAYDALVRDAQPGVSGNQEMVFVFSDGDGGPGSGSVTAPSTAKNVIAVGGIENVRSMSTANGGNNPAGDDGCFTSDDDANSANDIASFSSRGPTADGRIKPDLVAPSSHITGGAPQSFPPPSPSGTGSALDCFFNFGEEYDPIYGPGSLGVCGLPGSETIGASNFFPVGQQFFTESSGTSHSSPAVAGACALLRQYFINQSFLPPSPAMTKAYLMNSARYVTGSGANDNLFSNSQGMGALDLGMAFDGTTRILQDELTADKFTASGQTRTITGVITDPSKPFRVTLAWTDAPGSTTGPALNNDLDLTVEIAGTTYLGNVFHGANSVKGGAADHRNNVESVFLPVGTVGGFTVTITAANINSDGVPGDADPLDQDFALVIYNGMNATLANFAPVAGAYQGLIQASPFSQPNSGIISIIAGNAGTFSAKFTLGGATHSLAGVFDNDANSTSIITRPGTSSLTVTLHIDLTNGTDQITGTISDGTTTSAVTANLSPFNSKTNPATQYEGNYTIVLPANPSDTGPSFPQGNGYGTLTVDSGGNIRFSATLGDGTRISQTAIVSENGMWPVYIPLYSKLGSLEGLVAFTNIVGVSDLGGTLTWFKLASPAAKLYPNGFTTQITLLGSTYAAPPLGTPALNVSNATCNLLITSGAGDLSSFVSNSVTLNTNNKVMLCVTNGFKLTITTKTGLFSGSFVNPATTKPMAFRGVLFQKQNDGAGLFLGPDQTGFVTVEPSP